MDSFVAMALDEPRIFRSLTLVEGYAPEDMIRNFYGLLLIAKLGLPRARAATLHALANLLANEPTLLDPGLSITNTTDRLSDLQGIGPWTSSYIAMRALRWPDAFPDSDLGIKHALKESSPSRIRKLAEPWRPFRSYAAMHLWTDLSKRKS